MSVDPKEVAILTIHGHGPGYRDRLAARFAWEDLQIRMLRETTPPGYTVLAYGNDLPEAHAAKLRAAPEVEYFSSDGRHWGRWDHVWPIRNWLIRQAVSEFRYLVTLDSDAFPTREGWLDEAVSHLTESCPVVAVQRLENGDTHSDRCFVLFESEAWRQHLFDFSPLDVVDAGAGISRQLERSGLGWWPMVRSNAWNPHHLMAGIYDDIIYHHAAGSRRPRFRSNVPSQLEPEAWMVESALHLALMQQLFDDPQRFLARLRGESPPMERSQLTETGLTLLETFATSLHPDEQ